MNLDTKNYFNLSSKFYLIFIFSLLARLIPFRVPNIEPIMAGTMPLGRAYGALAGFFFASLSILVYDLLTNTLGVHTFFTAMAYGVIGLSAAWYFEKQEVNTGDYVRFAVVATLFFDAVTGLLVGPLFFDQKFWAALVGQIPFTALHLLGNITFAVFLSPAIYKFLIKPKKIKKKKQKEELILPSTPILTTKII